ncbi:NADH-quinone oxidoreductase subunit J family protein [Rhodoflexus caldus]|uniref:NADH-quinone oxidoreductase subunit J family protein n=1 Tax=Rhodoflexus caldus TaxID=2891236 RepID=UPI00202A4779|nr:NADH-quinone oxidoreductase subunit J [Rhodoflexus caldus]
MENGLLFYPLALMAVSAALYVLFTSNLMRAALALMMVFLSLAGIYALAGAEFVAAAQIMVYAGGILIILVFGLMFTSEKDGRPATSSHQYQGIAAVLSIALLTALVRLGLHLPQATPQAAPPSIADLGTALLTDYVLPLETLAMLLLLALVASVYIAAQNQNNPDSP